jgi:hypothetical protein
VYITVSIVPVNLAQADTLVAPQPLFESDETLSIDLELPYSVLKRDRIGEPEYHQATLSYFDHDDTVTIPLRVRVRGKTRRKARICNLPPLRLRFRSESSANTLFEHQKNVKLVTHCKDLEQYDQYVLREYLAYRIYNLLTQVSIRARLVKVRYLEVGVEKAYRYGVLLENWRKVAFRSGLSPLELTSGFKQSALNPDDANRLAVFQYLISNDDWSMIAPGPDHECCHNVRPLQASDAQVIPLPYDFDYSGLVNAPYAVTKRQTSRVRIRRFKGLCSTLDDGLDETLRDFIAARQAIEQLIRTIDGFSDKNRERTIKYIDKFYDVINDPKKVQKKLIKHCRAD